MYTACVFLIFSVVLVNSRNLPYKELTEKTSFQLLDPLVDRKWQIQNTHFENFPECSNQKITYHIKSHYFTGFKRRENIRTTWGQGKNLVFLCFSKNTNNQTLPPDSNSKDMLITDDYPESTDFFSVKIALGVFHASKCNSHAVFTDDDVYFFIDDFEKMISKNWNFENTVAMRGKFHRKEPPVRNSNSHWKKYLQSYEDYPFDLYPDFAHGAGYAASYLAIKKMAETLPYTRVLRHVDDVYFGLLGSDAKVVKENDDNFSTALEHVTGDDTYPCELYNLHGINHIEKFIEIKNEQCRKWGKKRFKVTNWRELQDPTVDNFE